MKISRVTTTNIAVLLVLIILVTVSVHSQTDQWARIQNDVGSFSIEVPKEYKIFKNSDGFWQSKDQVSRRLTNMNLLVAFNNGTLFSFETYKAPKAALDAFYDRDEEQLNWKKSKSIESDGVKIKLLVWDKDGIYAESRYFTFNGEIFVLTAASRNGNNESLKRFFDSMIIRPKGLGVTNGVRFSDLESSDIEIKVNLKDAEDNKPSAKSNTKIEDDPGLKRMVLLRLPNPSYIDPARKSDTVGTVRVKPVFEKDGLVSKIEINKELPNGLLRQALFAVIRLRYLPQERDGQPVSIIRTIEYNFNLY